MTMPREAVLKELELLPVWRQRAASQVAGVGEPMVEVVAQAASPANEQLVQGIHDRGYLPHLKAEGGTYFVTFRLGDSLPSELINQLSEIPDQDRSRAIEKCLDQGHGESILADARNAEVVCASIRKGDGDEYRLHAWCVMPNHVHLVLEPLPGKSLSDALQRIKSWSAHEINRMTGRVGALWQPESFDHLVRDDDELDRYCEYVRQNPVKAGLVQTAESYRFGGAFNPDAGEAACATGSKPDVDVPLGESRREAIMQMDWEALRECVANCQSCMLAETRTQTVFGVGDPDADWLLVGEAPGAEEDKRGEPFVGQAGKLLDNMLAAIQLKRGERVYIANVLKCRPPENRDPHGEEVVKCDPFLKRQVELIQPKLIVAMGRFAAQSILNSDASIGALRGKLHDYHGVPVIVTYHPAYLLRNLPDKALAWEDLCFARATMQQLQSAAATPST